MNVAALFHSVYRKIYLALDAQHECCGTVLRLLLRKLFAPFE